MNGSGIIGFVIVIAALGIVTYLVLWSRRTIDRIGRQGFRSARETIREMNRE